jgi:hypothetical protein
MVKILFYQQVNETLGLMSTLIVQVFGAVIPFLFIFFMWVIYFCMLGCILGANKSNADSFHIQASLGFFLTTYGNGIGNINNPSIAFLDDKNYDKSVLD